MSGVPAAANNQQASTTQQQPVPQEIIVPVLNNDINDYWAQVDERFYQQGLYQYDFEKWKHIRDYRDPPLSYHTIGFIGPEDFEQELQFDNLSAISDKAYLQEIHVEQLQRREDRAREHQRIVDRAWARALPTARLVIYLADDSDDEPF